MIKREIWRYHKDLNGDGTVDWIHGCSGFTMLNDGFGNFSLGSVKLPNISNVYASTISDFDNDGFLSMPILREDNVFYDLRLYICVTEKL